MLAVIIPIAAALFVWWFGTGVVLVAGRLGPLGRRAAFLALTAAAGVAVWAAMAVAEVRTPTAAYIAFTAGVVLWAWHEASFLFGYITGPRRTPCPHGLRGWRRFVAATETLILHEVAILATAAALVALTWNAANTIAAATFALLWIMRLSTKVNLYLGVSNFTDDFMPTRLSYLKSYFGPASTNALFPASAILAAGVTLMAFTVAWREGADAFTHVGWTLLGAMAGLATLEHVFLVAPWREEALWGFLANGAPRAPALAPASVRRRRTRPQDLDP